MNEIKHVFDINTNKFVYDKNVKELAFKTYDFVNDEMAAYLRHEISEFYEQTCVFDRDEGFTRVSYGEFEDRMLNMYYEMTSSYLGKNEDLDIHVTLKRTECVSFFDDEAWLNAESDPVFVVVLFVDVRRLSDGSRYFNAA